MVIAKISGRNVGKSLHSHTTIDLNCRLATPLTIRAIMAEADLPWSERNVLVVNSNWDVINPERDLALLPYDLEFVEIVSCGPKRDNVGLSLHRFTGRC